MRHSRTLALIAEIATVLEPHHPMTVRQVFYQLVSRQVIENTRAAYQGVSVALVNARRDGAVPWDWIEDRFRRPRTVPAWDGIADFGPSVVASYRRDVRETQPAYIEVWLEKDALSGVFENVLEPYGVTLNVGRGYDGWSSIRNAAERFAQPVPVTVLYYGDFDPSGEDMVRSLRDRLRFFDCDAEIVKVALTAEDIDRYELPPALTKTTDTRRARFVAQHGDVAVELDALPVDVLRERIAAEVAGRMDLDVFGAIRDDEVRERAQLAAMFR